jgi:hypothetical protein
MNGVDGRSSVNVGRAGLARALGLGPSCRLVLNVLGVANSGEPIKQSRKMKENQQKLR